MKKVKLYIIAILTMVHIFSCTEENELSLEQPSLVVEAFLIAGEPIQNIQISQSIPINSTDTQNIALENLTVSISDGVNDIELEEVGSGVFQDLSSIVQADTDYFLEIKWNDQVASSQTYVPQQRTAQLSKSSIQVDQIEAGSFGAFLGSDTEPLELFWQNPEGDNYLVTIENLENNPEFINENLADIDEDDPRLLRYAAEPTTADFFALQPMVHFSRYGTHRIVLYRVNPEYALLFTSTGSTTQSLQEPSTNISNGLGIFSGISSDTIFLEVTK